MRCPPDKASTGKSGEFDLTEWRESPLWKCVPTLPDVIVRCAKLMQSMNLSHVDMEKILTLHEHSSSVIFSYVLLLL